MIFFLEMRPVERTLMGEYHFWERTDLCMVW